MGICRLVSPGCVENCRDISPGTKELLLGFLLLRGHFSLLGMGGLQMMGLDLHPEGRAGDNGGGGDYGG